MPDVEQLLDDCRLVLGDCVAVLRAMPDCSLDSVVTDPPYGLEFMGKAWDSFQDRDANPSGPQTESWGTATAQTGAYAATMPRFTGKTNESLLPYQRWCEEWARECLRVLKPGGFLLAFGGTRTYHRLACAVEDAGFEIRDSIDWLYGSGFPKSLDVSKAIDKAAGAERTEVLGTKPGHEDFIDRTDDHSGGSTADGWTRPWMRDEEQVLRSHQVFAPVTPEAERWDGWGTALKPAHEPIVVARKPLIGTVVENVLAQAPRTVPSHAPPARR